MDRIFSFVTFMLFLTSGLYMTDLFNDVALLIMLVTSFVLLFYLLLLKVKNIKINVILFIIMTSVFVSIVLSSLINSDLSLLYQALVIYLSYLSLSVIYSRMYKERSLNKAYKFILITQIPLVLSVFIYGFNFPLQGIFYNPNSMGITAGTVYVVILARLLANMENSLLQRGKFLTKSNILSILICMFLFLITVGTASRTSTVAITIITIFSLFVLVFKGLTSRKYRSTFKAIFATILIPLLFLIIYNFPPINDYLYNNILYKFEVKSVSDNTLSTRDIVWRQTLNDATLFGNGREYFSDQVGIQAHNTFVSFLGQYGWVSLILFILFILTAFRYALKFARVDKSKFKYLPLFLIGAFILLSMAETMTHKAIMFAMFCAIGTISVSPYEASENYEIQEKVKLVA